MQRLFDWVDPVLIAWESLDIVYGTFNRIGKLETSKGGRVCRTSKATGLALWRIRQSTAERRGQTGFDLIVCGILPGIRIVVEHASALYTVRLGKDGKTIIGYHCAMLAALLGRLYSAHFSLTESTHAHQ